MDRSKRLRHELRAALERVASQGDPLDTLSDLKTLERFVDDHARAQVAAARAAGASWSDIASRLGVTRQAAHKRFGSRTPRKAVIELRLVRDPKKP